MLKSLRELRWRVRKRLDTAKRRREQARACVRQRRLKQDLAPVILAPLEQEIAKQVRRETDRIKVWIQESNAALPKVVRHQLVPLEREITKHVGRETERIKGFMRNLGAEIRVELADLRRIAESKIAMDLEGRQRWPIPVTQPLLLISQIQRTGGTLVSQLFDGHSECWAHPYELKWGRPNKWDWPQVGPQTSATAAFEQLDQNQGWLDLFANLGAYQKQEGPDSLLARGKAGTYDPLSSSDDFVHPFVFDRRLQRHIFRALMRQQPPERRRHILNHHLTAFFNAWMDWQYLYHEPKKLVTAFTPRVNMCEESLTGFMADYPDGFLLTLIRHPAAWYASATRHADPQYKELDGAINQWRASAEGSLNAVDRFPGRVLVAIFEDLVLDPEGAMRRICDTVGLTFNQCLTRPTFNGVATASNSSFHSALGVDRVVTDRYREVLSAEEVHRIEQRALPLYRRAQNLFGVSRSVGRDDNSSG